MSAASVNVTRLDNGMRVASQHRPGTTSAALGLWLAGGTRFEPALQPGVAHLLEHALFTGTDNLGAHTLAERCAALGGHVNAYTDRQWLALHAWVPAPEAAAALRMLTRMLSAPAWDVTRLAGEEEAIRHELAGKDPQHPIEAVFALAWGEHTLGRTLALGSREPHRLDCAAVRAYWRHIACGHRLVVAAAGDVDHAEMVAACRSLAELPAGGAPKPTPPHFNGGTYCRATGLGSLLFALPLPAAAEGEVLGEALAELLAGGPAARLYRSLRDGARVAYGVQARYHPFPDAGLLTVEIHGAPGAIAACRNIMEEAMQTLLSTGIDTAEWARVQAACKARLALEADDLPALAERLVRETYCLGAPLDEPARRAHIEALTAAQALQHVAEHWPRRLLLQTV